MMRKPSKRRNPKKTSFTFLAKLFKFFFISIIILSLAGGAYATQIILGIAQQSPEVSVQRFIAMNEPSQIMDMNGNFMDTVHTDEIRYPLDLREMGENTVNAFIAIEDERFDKHKGVDYRRTISVVVQDIIGRFTGRRGMEGGSTLTQQMIKNTFLTRDKEIERKIKEMYMALEAEKLLTKDQILQTYLNHIYLGGQAHGVEAAARQYFSKSAKDLSIIEAAYIAGTTQSPSVHYAFSSNNRENPQRIQNRTKTVLAAMYRNGFITEMEFNRSLDSIDRNGIPFAQTLLASTTSYNYEYFSRPVIDQVTRDLKDQKGYTDAEVEALLKYGGLTIYSTMDREAQEYAQEVLNDYENIDTTYIVELEREATDEDPESIVIEKEDGSRIVKYTERREAQAAFSAVDYRSGQVRVLVGGRNPEAAGEFNRAYYSDTFTSSYLKPPGSTTKPLTVYGPGLDLGILTLGSIADDSEIEESLFFEGYQSDIWTPQNVDFRYRGFTTIRLSVVHSYNTVAARSFHALASDALGRRQIGTKYASDFGLVMTTNPRYINVTNGSILALGGNHEDNKDGANALILANAYGAFGNSGVVTESILYTKVQDASGNILLDKMPSSRQVVSPQAAYLLYDVMRDVVSTSAPRTQLTNMPIAGKTGTSQDRTDLWFAGVSPYYSSAIWFGADLRGKYLYRGDSNAGQPSNGTQDAYGKIMAFLHEGLEVRQISRPGGLITSSFCIESGHLPNEQCYVEGTVRSDLFIDGTQPKSVCDVHVYTPPAPEPEPETPEAPGNSGGNRNDGGGNDNGGDGDDD